MPSKTPKQAKFMRAVAHGWKPSRTKAPPVSVAKEFVEADKKYSGGFAENRYWRGGLAAMDDPNAGYRGSLEWQRGGRVIPLDGGLGGGMRRAALGAQGWQYDPVANVMREPESTIAAPTGYAPPVTPTYSGPRLTGGRGGGRRHRNGGDEGRWRYGEPPEIDGGPGGGGPDTGGGGPGGPGTVPPRIIPSAPPITGGALPLDKESVYRDQLREHKARIAATLGVAKGGPVNYYQEGGAVRPGHAEGPNPYPVGSARYRLWERENHVEPAAPPPPAAEPEELSWWQKLMGYESGPSRTEEELAAAGEAEGGRVGYQYGGLAAATGPMPYRGVPPQRGMMQRGGGRGVLPGEMDPSGGGMGGRGGALQRAMMQMRQQRGGPRGGIPGRDRVGMPLVSPRPYKPMPGPGTFGPGEGIPGGGNIPPWKRPPGGRPQVPPSPGGGIPGGPRVPPNMQGYLQRMRMMNRPPSGPVGGGANRVGMQDQQGALARALQRGTGRPPMSRRAAFGRAGP
jgi:hypothetical protein